MENFVSCIRKQFSAQHGYHTMIATLWCCCQSEIIVLHMFPDVLSLQFLKQVSQTSWQINYGEEATRHSNRQKHRGLKILRETVDLGINCEGQYNDLSYILQKADV